MPEDTYYKLSAQVQALELIVKNMVAFQFAATVNEQTGFAKAAEFTKTVGDSLRFRIRLMLENAPQAARDTGVAQLMATEMDAVIGRCFDQPAASLREVADLVLNAMPAGSPGKN